MSAEQMRMELESFVNQGLQEDWRGWPMKGQMSGREEFPDARCLVSAAGMLLGYVRQSLVSGNRMLLLQGVPPEGGIPPLNGARTALFSESRPFLCDRW